MNLWKLMDDSVLKCSMYSLDRHNLFTGITSVDIKIVSCYSKGYKDFRCLSDEDLDACKYGNWLAVNKPLDLGLWWYSCWLLHRLFWLNQARTVQPSLLHPSVVSRGYLWKTVGSTRCLQVPSQNTLPVPISVFFRAVSFLCVWQPLVASSWVNVFGGFEGGMDKSLFWINVLPGVLGTFLFLC